MKTIRDVVGFGEAMLRLSVPQGARLTTADGFAAHAAGAELNVAANLAALGRSAGWVGAVPDNAIGEWMVNRLHALGIDDRGVVRLGDTRLGTFFVEAGVAPRETRVVYDRRDSAATKLGSVEVPWPYLSTARILHVSSITAAIGGEAKASLEHVLSWAHGEGIPVSFDVNYRSLLWSPEQANAWISSHVHGVELFTCAERDARQLFGLSGNPCELARALLDRFEARWVVVTSGAQGAVAVSGSRCVEQPALRTQVLDRIGAGDAFVSGVIDGWLDQDLEAGMERGAVLAALVLGQRGDQVTTNRTEVETLRRGPGPVSGVAR